MITAILGWFRWIRRATSTPLSRGRLISRRAISGLNCSTRDNASSPFDACPRTATPSFSSSIWIPCRTISSSSTRTTLILGKITPLRLNAVIAVCKPPPGSDGVAVASSLPNESHEQKFGDRRRNRPRITRITPNGRVKDSLMRPFGVIRVIRGRFLRLSPNFCSWLSLGSEDATATPSEPGGGLQTAMTAFNLNGVILPSIKVVLVDDDEMVRQGIQMLL